MLHLNLKPDLEYALRKISDDSGYALTTICAALMHLGLRAKAKDINDACAAHARPMGRPIVEVPKLEWPEAGKHKGEIEPKTPQEAYDIEQYLHTHPRVKAVYLAKWRRGEYK